MRRLLSKRLSLCLQLYADFKNSKWDSRFLSEIDFSDSSIDYKWSRGGLVWGDRFIESNAYPTPSKIINSSLLKLIEPNQTKSLYYLTPNAAEGILRRVDHQGRTLFAPLRTALELLKTQKI